MTDASVSAISVVLRDEAGNEMTCDREGFLQVGGVTLGIVYERPDGWWWGGIGLTEGPFREKQEAIKACGRVSGIIE